jgi:uncharacterized delta-60 repeat protein
MKKIIYISTVACLYLGFISFNTFAQNPGVLDASFNVGTGANNSVLATAIQSDGKIIIGGLFTSYNGTAVNRIARLNTDGTLDATFTAGIGSGANGNVNAICILNDGSIIIGGNFTQINNCGASKVARLDINGGQYCTNWFITNCNGQVNSLALQSDGKIIVGGDFTLIGGSSIEWRGVARIDINGIIDQSFISAAGITNGANASVKSVAVQSDGKIIVGGYFTTFNGVSKNKIARLNTNGSIDATFNIGTGFAGTGTFGVLCTKIQSDGKILVGGDYTSYNGTNFPKGGRLNTNGSVDVFSAGQLSGAVASFTIQSDGKIIVTGGFTEVGSVMNNIKRVLSSGTYDGTFSAGTGASSTVMTSSIQNDGKIIIGGLFTSYNGTAVNRIARIMGDCTPPPAPNGSSNQLFCSGATVADLSITGTNVQWYSSANGGNPLSSTAPLVSGNSYYASQTATCASLTRFQVTATINQPSDPTFDPILNTCQGDIFTLPSTSINGINGTWSPPIDNTTTTTYSFIPNVNECASSTIMTVVINPFVTPTFSQLAAICSGGSFTLPSSSNENISGTWLPTINNTATTAYSFTPNSGQCANTQSMTVIVDPFTTPTFSQVASICAGGSFTLPSSSNENISGTWLPAINNTATTSYTFTPSSGQCANTQTMSVVVNPLPTVTLATFNSVCDTAGLVNLTGGSPAGGTYSGTSVNNNTFNTSIGVGTYPITYSYTNNNGCSSSSLINLTVIDCNNVGLSEEMAGNFLLYPNPANDNLILESSNDMLGKEYNIFDFSGRIILKGKINAFTQKIEITNISNGSYLFQIENESTNSIKFVKM